jgi:hypothetical protein
LSRLAGLAVGPPAAPTGPADGNKTELVGVLTIK